MRHMKSGRKLNRTSAHRIALTKNLATALIEHGRIETTEAKAKEIKGIAEKMITLGKRGDLHAKRMALAYIQKRDVVTKLFDTIAPRSANRDGGYTRVIKTRVRLGDSAPMAIIELVDKEGQTPPPPKPKREKKKAAAPAPAAEVPKAETATAVAEPPAEPAAEAAPEAPAEEGKAE